MPSYRSRRIVKAFCGGIAAVMTKHGRRYFEKNNNLGGTVPICAINHFQSLLELITIKLKFHQLFFTIL